MNVQEPAAFMVIAHHPSDGNVSPRIPASSMVEARRKAGALRRKGYRCRIVAGEGSTL
jgi:hypothetical protein